MSTLIHPALLQLLRLQSRGRRRRIVSRLSQPRRMVLSIVAMILAAVWLGNAALTVWLRETGSHQTLQALLTFGLVVYAGWHVAKVAFFRPENPLEGESAERELLTSLPLGPRDLVSYQLASITVTTLFKAGLFAVMLLPDLRSLPLGFYGVFLAMFFLEMIRMAVEMAAWSMSRSLYTLFRMTVITVLVTLGVGVTNAVITQGLVVYGKDQSVFQPLISIVTQLNASVLSYLALPFVPFVELVLADGLTGPHLLRAALLTSVVISLMVAIALFYAATRVHKIRRERELYEQEKPGDKSVVIDRIRSANSKRTFSIWILESAWSCRCGGVGPLSWRQFLGAKRHWGGVLTALIAPAVFACVPLFVMDNRTLAFLATAGALAFYSFILLPTALRFDFHRDLNRLAILKGLPIGTMATVVGQILVPVIIATLFQFAVLTVACVARGLPPQYLLAAMLILIPANVLIFALENLIYLLYPYRIQQEGLEVFFRTMLTFTGKGLLFTFGLVAISIWGFQAGSLAAKFQQFTGTALHPGLVFAAGLIAALCAFATLTLSMLSRTYEQLDPMEDLPR